MAKRQRRSVTTIERQAASWFYDRTVGARKFIEQRPWWQTLLIVIGFVTTITVIGALFFGANNAPTTITLSDRIAPVDSSEFATTAARLVGTAIEHGGSVEVFNNGDEFLPVLLDELRKAQHTINFSVFIWRKGKFSDQVLDMLIERQQHGVEVRLLLDGWGGRGMPLAKEKMLKNAGGRVERYRLPGLGSWTRFHRRNHRRAVVIDGRVGFIGGIAVGDEWLGHAQDSDHWRDMMFRVTGPMALSLQAGFADEWVSSSGEIITGP